MDILTPLSRHIFVPFYKRRQGVRDAPIRRYLMRSQYFPEEVIRGNQWRDLLRIVQYAFDHTPFYRRWFGAIGLQPADLKTPSDFAELPVLTKDDIRNHLPEMISETFTREQLHWRRTGGSTGVPVQLYWDNGTNTFKSAVAYRHDSWLGYYLGMRRAALWGDTDKRFSFRESVYNVLCSRTIALDTLKMDERRILAFVNRIRKTQPPVLLGHGHSLYFFARFLLDRGITDIRFRGVIATAEALSGEERTVVEEAFGKVVYVRYGCEEVSLIASECEAHDGLHIAAEGLYTEVAEGNDETPGRLLVTDLTNRGMPLIRYEIGDLVTTLTGKCACGRGLPRFGQIVGRTSDVLYTPEGKMISGISVLDTFTIHIPGFKQVQIVQERLDELVFRIVKAPNYTEQSLRRLVDTIPKIFGPSMRHRVDFVDSIPLTQRGKFQFTICKIKNTDGCRNEDTGAR